MLIWKEIFYVMIIINFDCKKIIKVFGFIIFLFKFNVFDIRRDDIIFFVVFLRILYFIGD